MARTAKKSPPRKKPSLKSKAPSPPLADPQLRPLTGEHSRLADLNDDCVFAALDLTKELAGGKLRCQWRRRSNGEYWMVPPAFWNDYAVSCGSEGPEVISRLRRGVTPPLPPGVILIQSAELIARRQAEDARRREANAGEANPTAIPPRGRGLLCL